MLRLRCLIFTVYMESDMFNNQKVQVKAEKLKIQECPGLSCTRAFLDLEHLSTPDEHHEDMFLAHAISAYVRIEKVKIFECDYCTEQFFSRYHLLLHRLSHVENIVQYKNENGKFRNLGKVKLYTCVECDRKFVAESTLVVHSVLHRPFSYICHCGIGYYQQKDLQSHEILVHNGNLQIKGTPQNNDVIKSSKSNNTKTPPKSRRHKHESKIKIKLRFCRTREPLAPLSINFNQNDEGRYECPDCTKTFNAKSNAQCHYRAIHRGERPYVCHLCDKAFTQSVALRAHELIHSGRKDHSCQYCNKTFLTDYARIRHERTHTGEKPYKCTICEKAFSDPSAFARHKRIHTGDRRYRCEYCPKAFTDHSQLYVHRKRHNNERVHRCIKCKKKFYTKSDLRKHFDVVHEQKYNFQCDYCNKDFSSKINLQHHIQIHRDTRDTYTCDLCIKSFNDVQYLRKHIRTVHDRRRDYTCNICYKQFVDKSQLKTHLPIHNNVKKFECADCSRKYHSRSLLRAHIITKHINISCKVCKRNFTSSSGYRQHRLKVREKCDICEQEFDCKGEAKTHFNRVHVKRNVSTKYECDYCGRVFTQYLLIKKHILQFHSEYKYVCDHCGGRFALKESIRSHMKKHLEMLRCNICYKYFYSRFELQRHKEIPCTLITYTCDICGKSLSSSSGLKFHKLRHTDECGRYKCVICSKAFFAKSHVIKHIGQIHYKF